MATLGMHLLSQILFSRKVGELRAEEQAVRQAESLMREKLGERLDMRELAAEAGIDYDSFRRCFKALTGLPPKNYYRKLQMRRAEELLLRTGRSVADIADDLAFHSPFHLSAAFKEHAGLAPAHWRKKMRDSLRD